MLQHFHGSSEEGCVIEMPHRSTRGFLWKMPWILASPHRLLKWCSQSSYSSSATSHGRTGHSNHIFGPRPHSCILILHLHINPFPPLAPVVTGPCLHCNHAIFRSCRMVTTSLFPASCWKVCAELLFKAPNIARQLTSFIPVGPLKCFKHAYKYSCNGTCIYAPLQRKRKNHKRKQAF